MISSQQLRPEGYGLLLRNHTRVFKEFFALEWIFLMSKTPIPPISPLPFHTPLHHVEFNFIKRLPDELLGKLSNSLKEKGNNFSCQGFKLFK